MKNHVHKHHKTGIERKETEQTTKREFYISVKQVEPGTPHHRGLDIGNEPSSSRIRSISPKFIKPIETYLMPSSTRSNRLGMLSFKQLPPKGPLQTGPKKSIALQKASSCQDNSFSFDSLDEFFEAKIADTRKIRLDKKRASLALSSRRTSQINISPAKPKIPSKKCLDLPENIKKSISIRSPKGTVTLVNFDGGNGSVEHNHDSCNTVKKSLPSGNCLLKKTETGMSKETQTKQPQTSKKSHNPTYTLSVPSGSLSGTGLKRPVQPIVQRESPKDKKSPENSKKNLHKRGQATRPLPSSKGLEGGADFLQKMTLLQKKRNSDAGGLRHPGNFFMPTNYKFKVMKQQLKREFINWKNCRELQETLEMLEESEDSSNSVIENQVSITNMGRNSKSKQLAKHVSLREKSVNKFDIQIPLPKPRDENPLSRKEMHKKRPPPLKKLSQDNFPERKKSSETSLSPLKPALKQSSFRQLALNGRLNKASIEENGLGNQDLKRQVTLGHKDPVSGRSNYSYSPQGTSKKRVLKPDTSSLANQEEAGSDSKLNLNRSSEKKSVSFSNQMKVQYCLGGSRVISTVSPVKNIPG